MFYWICLLFILLILVGVERSLSRVVIVVTLFYLLNNWLDCLHGKIQSSRSSRREVHASGSRDLYFPYRQSNQLLRSLLPDCIS